MTTEPASTLPTTRADERRRYAEIAGDVDASTASTADLQQWELLKKAADGKLLDPAALKVLREKKYEEITALEAFQLAEAADVRDLAVGAKFLASKNGGRVGEIHGYGAKGMRVAADMIRERANEKEYNKILEEAAEELQGFNSDRRKAAFA